MKGIDIDQYRIQETPEFVEESITAFRDEMNKKVYRFENSNKSSKRSSSSTSLSLSKKNSKSSQVNDEVESNGCDGVDDEVAVVVEEEEEEEEEVFDMTNYKQAQEHCKEYVNSKEFILLFLRCEMYDIKAATKRMVNYWDAKVYFFGRDKAFRNGQITISDMNMPDDNVALNLAGIQILPKKDKYNRGMLFWDRTCFDDRPGHAKSMGRYLFYIAHAALEDVDIQKNGIIQIHSCRKFIRDIHRLTIKHAINSLPIRFVALHNFKIGGRSQLDHVIGQLLHMLGPRLRIRQVVHENLHILEEEYGINPKYLPRIVGGENATNFNFQIWLNDRRLKGL